MRTTNLLPPVRIALLLAGLFAMAPNLGCATIGPLKFGKEKIPQASDKNPVVQVLAMWQPGEGPGIDGKTTRGFVGQVYFFTANSAIAAKANGAVRVYLFDDQSPDDEQAKPLHQFDYPAESWTALGQPGKLGHSYSLFVPYTRPGFHKAQCSLRIKFVPEKGHPVHSDMSYVGLPGRKGYDEGDEVSRRKSKAAERDSGSDESQAHLATRPFGEVSSARPAGGEIPEALVRKLQSIDLTELRKVNQRPGRAPLDDRERERILREVRSQGGDFAMVEDSDRRVDDRRSRPSRSRRIVQANYEDSSDEEEMDEEADDLPPPARRRPVRRNGQRPSRAAVLADYQELDEMDEFAELADR